MLDFTATVTNYMSSKFVLFRELQILEISST